MAELLTERWTLLVAGIYVLAVSGISWWMRRLPAALAWPGIVWAWGLGCLHNLGYFPDAGHG